MTSEEILFDAEERMEKAIAKLKSKGKFTRTLSEPGKYRIHCTIHPGMEMKLTVKDLPTTTTAPPPPAT